jgi:hypothetical protein
LILGSSSKATVHHSSQSPTEPNEPSAHFTPDGVRAHLSARITLQ